MPLIGEMLMFTIILSDNIPNLYRIFDSVHIGLRTHLSIKTTYQIVFLQKAARIKQKCPMQKHNTKTP